MRCFAFITFIIISKLSFGQGATFNPDIDTTFIKSVKEPYRLWSAFLSSGDDSLGAQYWNKAEIERSGVNDYFGIEHKMYFGTDSLNLLKFWKERCRVHTLSIVNYNGLFKIKACMYFEKPATWDSTKKVQDFIYCFSVYAKEENKILKLYNAEDINVELNWNSMRVGYLHYHYPKNHQFDMVKARKQNEFILKLCNNFKTTPDTVDYYFADTREQLNGMQGYDYIFGSSGKEIPSGIANPTSNKVYCTGTDEYYPHELVHIFLNPKFPNSHNWFNEGLATLLGGSRGRSLDWHLERAHNYLEEHPEVNLDSMLNYRNMDEYTDYRYVFGGLIMKMAFDKGGYSLITKFMESGKSEEDFYKTIEKHLSIKQKELNVEIRKILKSLASE